MLHTDEVPRAYYPIPTLAFDRALPIGNARFLSAGTLNGELQTALTRALSHESSRAAQRHAATLVNKWAGWSVLEITAPDVDGKVTNADLDRAALEVMRSLRFFVRPLLTVNVDRHRFGIAGEMPDDLRDYILLWDGQDGRLEPLTAPGWYRVGGTATVHLTTTMLDTIENNPAFQFVSDALSVDRTMRTPEQARPITSIAMINVAYGSLDETQRVLCAAIAVESLLGDNTRIANAAKLARRAAFTGCGGSCQTGTPACPYLKNGISLKALAFDLEEVDDRGEEWRCSAYLRIAAPDIAVPALNVPPLMNARNDAAHDGYVDLDERTVGWLVWAAERTIMAGLDWFASNGGTVADLDAAIDAVP